MCNDTNFIIHHQIIFSVELQLYNLVMKSVVRSGAQSMEPCRLVDWSKLEWMNNTVIDY